MSDDYYYQTPDDGTGGRRTPPPPPPPHRSYAPRGYQGGYGPHDYSRERPYAAPGRDYVRQPYVAPADSVTSNPMGLAGFIMSIVMFLFWWTPYAGFPLWIMAVVFSAIGLNRKPRALAIAGLVIAVAVPLMLILFVVALFGTVAALNI